VLKLNPWHDHELGESVRAEIVWGLTLAWHVCCFDYIRSNTHKEAVMKEESSPRWINIAVGIWLVASAFIWPHTTAQLTNAVAVGVACSLAAAAAMRVPPLRHVNAGLALWLFFSTWVLPVERGATLWNNVLVALVMLVVAMVPSRREREMAYH
jgi:SPW repeat